MTKIINLYGGPSVGKSTAAAYLYYLLKQSGYNTELVREYIKEWSYEKRLVSTYDQIYIMGKQVRKESLLYDKVDWIITDSPVLMNVSYAKKYCPADFAAGVQAATLAFYKQAENDGHKHIHILLERTTPYKSEGRYQNEEQAIEIDGEIKNLLDSLNIKYIDTSSDDKKLFDIMDSLTNVK